MSVKSSARSFNNLRYSNLVILCNQGYWRRYKFTILCSTCNSVRMKILVIFLLNTLTGVLSRMFYFTPWTFKSYFLPYARLSSILLILSGGPIGPVTFTALSTRSINIQIDKGSQLGRYQHFFVQRPSGPDICRIAVNRILNDCTDGHATQGNNHYRIGADYPTGVWSPDSYYANTLQQDRTHFLSNC